LPFPPAVIPTYLLAAIHMTVLSAGNKVRPGRIDHRLWLAGEQRAGHLPDVFGSARPG
jgi:hypothetical protein